MKKQQSIPDQIWQFFCSVKLAVYTLILLASTSVIGTIILQNGSEQQYLKEYGPGFYNLIKIFDFDDMYHAKWFIGLIVILCINIVVCSIERLSVTWKIIFPKKITVNPDRYRKQKNLETFLIQKGPEAVSGQYASILSKKVGSVISQQKENSTVLYAETGRWTRLGVYIVHLSILLLLMGALIGVLFGFKANMNLDEGHTSHMAFDSKNRVSIELGFDVRCNDFNVSFYDTGAPKEFKSNLTILEQGKEIFTQDILVNHPLRYKGINIFQSSYGSIPSESVVIDIVRLEDDLVITKELKIGDTIELPDDQGEFLLEGFVNRTNFRNQDLGPGFIGKILPKNGEPFQIQLPLRFSKFDRMRKGRYAFVINKTVEKYYTGLQITKDPGVWYVYAGFIFMIIGCWITFFMSHQSYMIEIVPSGNAESMVSVSGISNRNAQGMKLKIKKLINQLKG